MTPTDPFRDALKAMTGVEPPDFVSGYNAGGLDDKELSELQDWAADAVKPTYFTGIGLIEAAEDQVAEAVSNGNIPPNPQVNRAEQIEKQLVHLRVRYDTLLRRLEEAVLYDAEERQYLTVMSWHNPRGKLHEITFRGNQPAEKISKIVQCALREMAGEGTKCKKKTKKVPARSRTRNPSKTSTRR